MQEKRIIKIANEEYTFNIYIERRNSTRVSITNHGVNIRIPRHLSRANKEKEIDELIHWAAQRIQNTALSKQKKKTYKNNDYLKTHSRIYTLQIEIRPSEKNFSKIQGNYIVFKIADKHEEKARQKYISKQLQKLLAKEHLEELKYHVNRLNLNHFNKEINKISYKYTKSRWGACKTQDKEIDISTKLLLAPLPVLEYVITHELAHLIEPNHSPRFWNIVKSIDPSYKQKKKWLNINGNELNI